ncbi:MAG: exonuclease domain-containing protein [Gammaproteobacteria bacterium]
MCLDYVLLDIEASSFSDNAYPVEIAWGNEEGIESYLLDPSSVESWQDWSQRSEAVHGISQIMLASDGHNPREIYRKLDDIFSTKTVYSDEPEFDLHWLSAFERIFGCHTKTWKIHDIRQILYTKLESGNNRSISAEEVLQKARSEATKRHRAHDDVEILLKAVQIARG